MLLAGKVIIVSGVGPGLGSKLALHAAIEGARGVVLSGRTQEKLDRAEAAIQGAGARAEVLKQLTDIREADQCQALAKAAVERFGGIDALVNNAYFHGPMGDDVATTDFAAWPEQFNTNVFGTLKMSQAVLPQMKAQGGGAIVMINTMGAKMVPLESEGGYCGSKAALWNLSRKLAAEVGPDGIRVNNFHPGWMWGEPVRNALKGQQDQWGTEEEAYAKVSSFHALRRIATDDECARAALFLASDYASAVTGASLDCNAGGYMP